MSKKYLQHTVLVASLMGSTAVIAMPFNSFDPRSMAMGGTGVAVGDPSTAPFFNPAMLTASDPSKKYSIEFPIIGATIYDPSNMHTNLQTLANSATPLTNSVNTLNTNSTSLSTSVTALNTSATTLTTNITNLAAATPANAASTLTTLSSNITTVQGNMTTVSNNSATVATNVTTVNNNIIQINQILLALNNQPLQAEFGAATVIGIPGKDWGFAYYADAWGAVGGTLEYKDAGTVSTISTALTTTSTALNSTSTALGNGTTGTGAALTSANNALTGSTGPIAVCTAAAILAAGSTTTCQNALTTANTALGTAQTSITNNATTVQSNATKITNAATTVSNINNNGNGLQSQVHLRGVLIEESGLSISHNFVTSDHSWSLGFTPKVMNLQLYDATLSANNGTSTSGVTGNDYLAKYNALNIDMGVAKSYNNGWRTGVVVKNLIPENFNFMSIASGAASGSVQSVTGQLNLNPQARLGVSHENVWSAVAFDLDMTKNNPAGLENQSQYAGIGGELSAWGWAQIRAGYKADLLNKGQELISLGFGLSPRIPYFKPHFDLAITASKDILSNGFNNATQAGASLKAGFNF